VIFSREFFLCFLLGAAVFVSVKSSVVVKLFFAKLAVQADTIISNIRAKNAVDVRRLSESLLRDPPTGA
jgi:hypothetical protein